MTHVTTFQLVSFGCKVNQAEGETLAARLSELGLAPTAAEDGADLVIVNTCAVTAEAARQCRQRIRRALRRGAQVVVTGCAAHPAAGAMAAVSGPMLVEPDKDRAVQYLARQRPLGGEPQPRAPDRSRALLKVQDGCPASCAYCIVPKVRPTARSTPPDEVQTQVRQLLAEGFKEVVLCGIHLGLYGADLGVRTSLADLVRRLLATPGLGRLRLSSIEPMEVTDELLSLMASAPERLCPHLHMPLQSGDDCVLRRMGRPYSSAEFLAVAARIRQAVERPAIATDVLVGFPGESEEAFAETLRVCRKAGFSRLHVFPFSMRPGTLAATMGPGLPRAVIQERRCRAAELGARLAAAYRVSQVGHAARVVIEKMLAEGAEGLSERYLRVRIRGALPTGAGRRAIVPVRITGACGDRLEAAAASPDG
jgi:threonylcarbamoyladenosine tRNA methylthiotransferase MtaB